MPRLPVPPPVKPAKGNRISWAGYALALIPATLLTLFALRMPSHSEQIDQQTQLFLARLKTEDKANLKATFTSDLSARFTSQSMLDFAQREGITPLSTWTIVNINHFKLKGVAHVQTQDGLIRLDYVGTGKWRLQDLCQVDRFIEETALSFVGHLRSGDLNAAQQLTVDAAFPRRKGLNFPPDRMAALQHSLTALPEPQIGQLELNPFYSYRQSIEMGEADWMVQLHHWDYDRSGCRFFVFDIKQLER